MKIDRSGGDYAGGGFSGSIRGVPGIGSGIGGVSALGGGGENGGGAGMVVGTMKMVAVVVVRRVLV